jgi:NAD(P)-dependent dehydrogenase (short-subunit alcohol dehydrogenase family)
MVKPRNFEGKVVVITGAAGGLGAALARRFARAGARLALLDLDQAAVEQAAMAFTAQQVPAVGLRCDVADPGQVAKAMEQVLERFGGVDVLINNAGIAVRAAFEHTHLAVFHKVMAVNFFGALYGTRAALPSLRRRRGLIITISSLAGFSPLLGRSGYAASKHALHGLFDSLRSELRGSGVGVLIVCPGFMTTGIGRSALDGDGSSCRHPQTTAGRPVTPQRVADQIFTAASKNKRLLVLTFIGRLGRFINKLSPTLYEWLMVRSMKAELQRKERSD